MPAKDHAIDAIDAIELLWSGRRVRWVVGPEAQFLLFNSEVEFVEVGEQTRFGSSDYSIFYIGLITLKISPFL